MKFHVVFHTPKQVSLVMKRKKRLRLSIRTQKAFGLALLTLILFFKGFGVGGFDLSEQVIIYLILCMFRPGLGNH